VAAETLWKDTGVFLPPQLSTHSSMAYILNQEKGRLRVTDIKRAIEEREVHLAAVNHELELLDSESGGVDVLDNEEVAAPVKVDPPICSHAPALCPRCLR
jgi:hypothetical protein